MRKFSLNPRPTAGTKIATLATQVIPEEGKTTRETSDPLAAEQHGSRKPCQGRSCKVCKQHYHEISKCGIFLSRSSNWRRRFARMNKLCYRCLSSAHLRKKCQEKRACEEADCSNPMSHHTLLHSTNARDAIVDSAQSSGNIVPASNLPVNKATTEDPRRSFVLLKVVPLLTVVMNVSCDE